MSEKETSYKPEKMDEFFDIRADSYDNHMKENVTDFDELYTIISDPIIETDKDISILDIGCGTGLELESILKKAPNARITGIDLSEKMLSELQRKYIEYQKQIRIIKDSYLTHSLEQNHYDYVLSVMTVHHLLHDKKRELYKKIRKSLNETGVYIEGDYIVSKKDEEQYLAEYMDFIKENRTIEEGTHHIDIPFSIGTQTKLLKEAGFSKIDVIWNKGDAAILVASV